MESWDWVPASVIYGMGVGGLMFACSVRCESIYEAARKLWNHSRTDHGRIAPGAAQRPAADRTADFDSEAADSPPPAGIDS
jgi:hypothetical protein